MQRLFGADLRAFIAENALCSIFSPAGFFINLHVHGTDPQTFAAVDAFTLVTMDPQQGEIAHGLEKHRDGAEILAERAAILERKRQRDARDVVECVSGQEHPEHDLLQIRGLHQEQAGNQRQRQYSIRLCLAIQHQTAVHGKGAFFVCLADILGA